MAKKKMKFIIPGAIALVFGIVAFCMMFVPAITFNSGDSSSDGWTGAQLAFGYKETIDYLIGSAEFTILEFNIVALLAFALPLVGGILALIFKNGLLAKILTTACFVVGAVLLFSIVGYSGLGRIEVDTGISFVDNIINGIYDSVDSTKGLGAGPIVAGILSVLGALVCFFKGTIAKKFS